MSHPTRLARPLRNYQNEKLNRGSELTVVHESLLEEDNADEGEALLAGSEKVNALGWALTAALCLYACTGIIVVSGFTASTGISYLSRTEA